MDTRHRKAFIAGLMHETNAFSPVPTNLESFSIWRPEGALEPPPSRDTFGYGAYWRLALAEGLDVSPGFFAICQPSAALSAQGWAALRKEILADLDRAGEVDRVFLMLHGAQCAQDTDDVEADLLRAVRARVGPSVPIAAVLDLHANISAGMLEAADYLLACHEYPHTDFESRAHLAYRLLERHVGGGLQPVTVALRLPVVGAYPTPVEPMRSVVALAREVESRPGVLAVSICHGFWLSDTADAGSTVLVTTQGDADLAEALAQEIADRYAAATAAVPQLAQPPAAAVRQALELAAQTGRPSVVADRCDNPGGGAAGDSTFVLRELLACGSEGLAFGMLWDPMAVDFAHRAGVGARLRLRLGGKVGPCSGEPLDVEVEVLALRDDARQAAFAQGEPRLPLGRTARLRAGGVDIIVNTERQQVFDPRVFTAHGIEPSACRVIVVKSTTHFRNGFAPLAGGIVECETPGSVTTDPTLLAYRKLRRPMAPLDPGTPVVAQPLGTFSRAGAQDESRS
jgi:microcystin degradation protein MlrC